MTDIETIKNLLTELIEMIDNGSQKDLDRADEIATIIIKALKQEPKIGHWIDRFPLKECKCSVCDFLICISSGSYSDMAKKMKFCPNCGTRMLESEG